MIKQYFQRFLSCLLISSLLIPLFPASAEAAPLSESQITAQGTTRYYNTSGAEVASGSLGSNNIVTSVTKTINGTDIENEFMVNLTVKTTKVLTETKTSTPDAAVILILDTSSLMSSNLSSMKTAAINFLNAYAKDAAGSSRYVSLITFGSKATIQSGTMQGGWIDVSNAANLSSLKNFINYLTADQNTFIEGAFLLARNLLRTDAVPKSTIENRSVIIFTKALPNEYGLGWESPEYHVNMSFSSINPFTGSGVAFGHGKNHAAAVANNIKNSINFTIGGSTLYSKHKANIYTVYYPINAPNDPEYRQWLRDSIASAPSYAYESTNVSQLNNIFLISKQAENSAQPGIVTETMGNNIEFIQSISQNESSYLKFTNNTLEWDLKNAPSTLSNNIYTYSYSYRIRLNTTGGGFAANVSYPTTSTSKLNYVIAVDGVTQASNYTANFSVTSVKGFLGLLNFTKANDVGDKLAGFAFKLENKTSGKPTYSATSSSSGGAVSFDKIPSGYTYTLTETSVPENLKNYYQVSNDVLTVTVSMGNVTVKNSADQNLSTNFIFVNQSKKLITKEYKTTSDIKLQNDETKLLSIGDTFSDLPAAFTGYTYDGYKINNGTLTKNNPSFKLVAGDPNKTVTYIYKANTYTITIKYQNRAGTQLKTDTTVSAAFGSTYTAAVTAITGYTFVDWKHNTILQGNKSPSFTVPASNVTVILVYAQDRDANGTEDILVTKEYRNAANSKLQNDETKIVNVGSTFSDPPAAITGYTYNGYKINNGSQISGTPFFTVAAGDTDKTVTYVYTVSPSGITIKYQDRAGNLLKNDTTISADFGSTYTAAITAIPGYTFVNWQYNGVLQGNKNPSFTVPATSVTVILVYARDRDGNGIEDILVTKEYKDTAGTKLQNDETKIVNIGSIFSDIPGSFIGYSYNSHKINNGSQTPGIPSFSAAAGDPDKTVTYIYNVLSYGITIKYQDRAGNLLKADTTASADFGSMYTVSATAVSGYTFVDWQYYGIFQGNKNPSFTVPASSVTVILVYAPDRDGNGTEDILVKKIYKDTLGNKLLNDETKIVNVGSTFSDADEIITGYTYFKHQLDNDAPKDGRPNFMVMPGDSDKTVTYLYNINNYNIMIKYQDLFGKQIGNDTTDTASYSSIYNVSVPGFPEYALEDWLYNGVSQGKNPPSFTVPAADVTIILIYRSESVQITKKFMDASGRPLRDDETKGLAYGKTFGDPHEEILWHTYLGFQIDKGTLTHGEPSFTVTEADLNKTVTYVYEPDQDIKLIQTVANEDGNNIDGGTARERDILRYTIRAEAVKALSAVGPITIEDVLPPELQFSGGQVVMITSTDLTPVPLYSIDNSNILVQTDHYLSQAGDWLELSFEVAVLNGSTNKVMKNTAKGSADNLYGVRLSNTTEVTILERLEGSLTITKQDSQNANKKLSGAVFEIWDTGTNTKMMTTEPTKDGLVTVSLPFGIYRFVEIVTPAGYKTPPNGNITAKLLQDTSAIKGQSGDTFTINEEIETATVRNTPDLVELTFTKIDGNAFTEDEILPISGVEFAIFRCPDPKGAIPLVPDEVINGTGTSTVWEPVMVNSDGTGEVPYRVKSDKDGIVTFYLENGAYMLVETHAPRMNGYQYLLPSGQWAFRILDSMTPSVTSMAVPDEYGQFPPAFTEENQLLNYRLYALPESGGSGTKAFVWGGSLLAGIGLTLLIIRFQRTGKPNESVEKTSYTL